MEIDINIDTTDMDANALRDTEKVAELMADIMAGLMERSQDIFKEIIASGNPTRNKRRLVNKNYQDIIQEFNDKSYEFVAKGKEISFEMGVGGLCIGSDLRVEKRERVIH